jgi:hypothetical protein
MGQEVHRVYRAGLPHRAAEEVQSQGNHITPGERFTVFGRVFARLDPDEFRRCFV